ncbi:PIG-L deacetylase family protein [Tomitella biformata]|uniref:PIG-L deacetylase family protein n=1 Tax=Tomitella biformata TaxID=630403 RepID=UPI000463E434|nr:PIG-L deacetylase family protein [Tomitella biformata]
MTPFPEDWSRALVLVAHPDDAEYGIAPAVAKWTAAGKDVRYVLATRGEAGIAGLPPHESGPVREAEQIRSAAVVGVDVVEFLGHPDGRLEEGLALRQDLAAAIRRHEPELILTLNHRDHGAGGRINTADHRILGRSVFDATADAANEWIFPELAADGSRPWAGVRWIAVVTTSPTHALPVDDKFVEIAVDSLAEHRRYLEALSDAPVEAQARAQVERVTAPRPGFGDGPAIAFELFPVGG